MGGPNGSVRPETARIPRTRLASFSEELAEHEALLRRGSPASCVAVHRGEALSYGVGVGSAAAYLARAREAGLSTVRRTSGGTAVLHLDGDVLWAVVLPRSDERVGRDFVRAYGRLGEGVVRGLAAAGVRAAWAPAPGLADDYCFLSSRGEVLVVEGRVVGGAAQHATSRALLHHGSIAWTVDRARVDRLFDLPAGGASLRLGGLADLRPPAGPGVFAEAIARVLAAEVSR